MKLTIGSVHFKTDFWLPIQTCFIGQHTHDYEYVVHLNNVENPSAFNNVKVVGSNNENLEMHHSHSLGLKSLVEYFKSTDSDYFLILDSDCFPIQRWQDRLHVRMGQTKRHKAIVVRCETMSLVAHPSVIYLRREDLDSFDFNDQLMPPDLLGNRWMSPIGAIDIKDFYPLTRTNVWNPHPVYAGVYCHMFYHHGCGSRPPIGGFHYYDIQLAESADKLKQINHEIAAHPQDFINRLCGVKEVKIL